MIIVAIEFSPLSESSLDSAAPASTTTTLLTAGGGGEGTAVVVMVGLAKTLVVTPFEARAV